MSAGQEVPSISVAMATFNGERFLSEQLASLAKQTKLPTELVVVDDCSTDSTVSILGTFAASAPFPVRLSSNETSQGHGETFFRALGACTSDLVAFCDQDDLWHREKLARCAAVFAGDPSISLLVHAGRVVDEDLHPTPVRVPDIRKSGTVEGWRLSPWFVHRGFAMVIPLWLRDVTEPADRPRAFRRNEDRPMDHDEWACFLAPSVGSVALLADELASHRRHGENFSVMEAPGLPVPEPLRRVRGNRAKVEVVRPALGGDRGASGLLDADVKAQGYRALAAQCRQAALFLDSMPPEHRHAARRGRLYERAAAVLGARADAIDLSASPVRRVTRVLSLALRGGYGRRRLGGTGPMSLPLDLVVAIGGRRAPSLDG